MLSIGELALGDAATAGINTRIPWSALEYSAGTDVITSISGSSIGSTVDTSQLMPKSASGDFYPMTGNPSGFLTDDDLDPYAHESSLSGKMDKSASSEFYPMTGNPSGFVTGGPYQPSGDYVYESSFSAFSSDTTVNISNLSSIVSSISGNTGDYVEKSAISAESSKWNEVSGLSGKLDKSASSDFYSTSNPSGFISSADAATSFVYNSAYSSFSSETTGNISSLSSMVSAISGQTGDYVEKSSISAESSQWNEVSGLSGKLDSSASSSFYPMTGNPSGFLTSADGSGYIPFSAIETDENSAITAISGSAIAGGGGLTGDYVEKSAFHLQIGTGNTVLANTANPNSGTWAVIGSGHNVSLDGSAFADNGIAHVIIGRNNSATWGTAITLGADNNSHGKYADSLNILIGKGNSASGNIDRCNIAIGRSSLSIANSISIGQGLSANNFSVSIGSGASADNNSIAIDSVGYPSPTIASGKSYAIGDSNSAYKSSVSIGRTNSASAASLSVGFFNTATDSSNLYGYGLVGDSGITVLGRWNSASAGSSDTAFVVGDGSGSSQRHDLMLLLRSGDIIINGSSNSGVPIISSIKNLSSTMSSYSSTWGSVTGRIPYSALKYAEGTTTITAIWNSAIGGTNLNTAAMLAGVGISIDLSSDGNYYINNTSRSRASARDGFGISGSSYTDAGGVQYTTFGLDSAESYIGTQFRYAIQSSFQATAYEQEVPLIAHQGHPNGYTSYMVKLDAIVSCPYAATWSLVEIYNNTWDSSSASAVIALDRTEGGNSSMVHLRGETLAGGNNASARMVNVMVKFDEAPVGDPTVTVHDQVGYFVRIPQGLIANGWTA